MDEVYDNFMKKLKEPTKAEQVVPNKVAIPISSPARLQVATALIGNAIGSKVLDWRYIKDSDIEAAIKLADRLIELESK
jgi:hypothetical protein